MGANDSRLLTSFWFKVSLIESPKIVAGSQRALTADKDAPTPPSNVVGDGAFQECGGLEVEMDVQEYQEGGRNNGVIRRIGRAKYQPIVLKRGMFFAAPGNSDENKADDRFWMWMQSFLSGNPSRRRYDGIIYVMSPDQKVRATWVFERGLPAKVKGPDLNGKSGEIAIEELHIAHEGLHMLPSGKTSS